MYSFAVSLGLLYHFDRKSQVFIVFNDFYSTFNIIIFEFYVNFKQDIGRHLPFLHDIWCRIVANIYTRSRGMFLIPLFGCPGIMAKSALIFEELFSF